ncbi:DUF2513 domain-containing protein [Malikia sp.]|uniref:DUF2513 domain-containing protein n=1 Tax=Malikia sp. TaxID=2070706 RepID=UPI002603C471|nr:DUF2513 domain-containing protein [Malikia sp.]MDD2728191.1 DUF2513 domain-containing protein [Malikia sp.]
MKRDMDLIRRIAFATEALENRQTLDALDGVDPATFAQHVVWMKEAGLIEAVISEYMGTEDSLVMVQRLTWQGCDFLDAARDEGLWSKAKATIIKPSASFTFGVLKDWLASEIRQGLPTLGG